MTLRTSGKGEEYRYYTCCAAARQGKTGCKGRTVAMADLNELAVDHVERRLLDLPALRSCWEGSCSDGRPMQTRRRIASRS